MPRQWRNGPDSSKASFVMLSRPLTENSCNVIPTTKLPSPPLAESLRQNVDAPKFHP